MLLRLTGAIKPEAMMALQRRPGNTGAGDEFSQEFWKDRNEKS